MARVIDFQDVDEQLEQRLSELHPEMWHLVDSTERTRLVNVCNQLLAPLYYVPDGFFVRLGTGAEQRIVQTFNSMTCLISGTHAVSRFQTASGRLRFLRSADQPTPLGTYSDITAENAELYESLKTSRFCSLPGVDTVEVLFWLKDNQVIPSATAIEDALERRSSTRSHTKVLKLQ